MNSFRQTRVLTKPQRLALKRVYDRGPIFGPLNKPTTFSDDQRPNSYLKFRRTVQIYRDHIMVPWYGMWLGIEHDGYTHS